MSKYARDRTCFWSVCEIFFRELILANKKFLVKWQLSPGPPLLDSRWRHQVLRRPRNRRSGVHGVELFRAPATDVRWGRTIGSTSKRISLSGIKKNRDKYYHRMIAQRQSLFKYAIVMDCISHECEFTALRRAMSSEAMQRVIGTAILLLLRTIIIQNW